MSKNKTAATLCLLFFLMLGFVALFFFPLLRYCSDPTATYLTFKTNSIFFGILVLILLSASVCYLWIDKKLAKEQPKLSTILIALAALSLILIFVFPIGASDFFLYISQARTFSINNLNPYFNSYSQLTNDVFYPFLKGNRWIGYISSYGPLFILIASGLALVTKSSFLGTVILFKAFLALIHIANTYLISRTMNRRYAWLYGFNPLIIFEFLINGHNESIMILFCLISFYFLWKKIPNLKNSLFSVFFLTLGILTKFIPLIILPIWIIALLWRLDDKREKKLFFILSIPLIITTGFLIYWPFWQGVTTIIKPITNQMRFFNHLLVSPAIAFIYNIFTAFKINKAWELAILVSRSLFLGFVTCLGVKIIKEWGKQDIKKLLNYGTIILLAFFASFFPWLMPWYFTFLLLLLLMSHYLNNQKWSLMAFYIITFLEITYYLVLR